jgi:hypothetical protein
VHDRTVEWSLEKWTADISSYWQGKRTIISLPDFNATGDLPPGVHRATLDEVLRRFGAGGGERVACTRRLSHIHQLAQRTGHLQRFVIFGGYVTAKPDPNDVDVVLVMDDAFRLEDCLIESRGLFDHALAQARYGASIFWIRPGMLIVESIEDFIAYWQIKRDGSQRGIVEVVS